MLEIEDDPKTNLTLLNIAMVKAWNFGMEYDKVSGREKERDGFCLLYTSPSPRD